MSSGMGTVDLGDPTVLSFCYLPINPCGTVHSYPLWTRQQIPCFFAVWKLIIVLTDPTKKRTMKCWIQFTHSFEFFCYLCSVLFRGGSVSDENCIMYAYEFHEMRQISWPFERVSVLKKDSLPLIKYTVSLKTYTRFILLFPSNRTRQVLPHFCVLLVSDVCLNGTGAFNINCIRKLRSSLLYSSRPSALKIPCFRWSFLLSKLNFAVRSITALGSGPVEPRCKGCKQMLVSKSIYYPRDTRPQERGSTLWGKSRWTHCSRSALNFVAPFWFWFTFGLILRVTLLRGAKLLLRNVLMKLNVQHLTLRGLRFSFSKPPFTEEFGYMFGPVSQSGLPRVKYF